MDSLTHLYLADALMDVCSGDRAAVPCALFPQIDRVPAYYHRLYAHPFSQGGPILQVAGGSVWPDDSEPAAAIGEARSAGYFSRRLRADSRRINGYARKYADLTGRPLVWRRPADHLSMAVAFASHAYQDTFNNPIQAFLPYNPLPSGRWDLWKRNGGLDFRWTLYQRQNIEALRAELFNDPMWKVRLPATTLCEAIVRRTAAAAVREIPEPVIVNACRDLGIVPGESAGDDLRTAVELLTRHEELLDELILKYADPARSSDSPDWTGDGHTRAP